MSDTAFPSPEAAAIADWPFSDEPIDERAVQTVRYYGDVAVVILAYPYHGHAADSAVLCFKTNSGWTSESAGGGEMWMAFGSNDQPDDENLGTALAYFQPEDGVEAVRWTKEDRTYVEEVGPDGVRGVLRAGRPVPGGVRQLARVPTHRGLDDLRLLPTVLSRSEVPSPGRFDRADTRVPVPRAAPSRRPTTVGHAAFDRGL